MKAKKEVDSPVVEFLQCVWTHEGKADGSRSWRRLNSALHTTLATAIVSGFKFSIGDFEIISKRFNSGYWSGDGEGFYARACASVDWPENPHGPNISACIAYEAYRQRPAFILEDRNGRRRLAVGSRFRWNGQDVRVTSIKSAEVVACSYKGNTDERKIDKRYNIGFSEIAEVSKAWRKAKKTPETD